MTTLTDTLIEATQLCHDLLTVINAETEAVRTRRMEKVPDLAKKKERLTAQLEDMLAATRDLLADPAAKAAAAPLLAELQTAVGAYDTAARQNLLVLQAAHQSTGAFLDAVRQAVAKPRAETYGNTGTTQSKGEHTSLINKTL
jgi:flagellar biosynthesis/type III secretory pathway chaperone